MVLASLTSTCRRHQVDPQLYLTQLLVNLPSWPANHLDAWLPDLPDLFSCDICAIAS
ncbi:MAG: transposase domain-containing protein [Candidatus Korobacteraceae bacterium]